MEVEVATDNALHWQKALNDSNVNNHHLRKQRSAARAFIRKLLETGVIQSPVLIAEADEVLKL